MSERADLTKIAWGDHHGYWTKAAIEEVRQAARMEALEEAAGALAAAARRAIDRPDVSDPLLAARMYREAVEVVRSLGVAKETK